MNDDIQNRVKNAIKYSKTPLNWDTFNIALSSIFWTTDHNLRIMTIIDNCSNNLLFLNNSIKQYKDNL
jgi:hypothetical protein